MCLLVVYTGWWARWSMAARAKIVCNILTEADRRMLNQNMFRWYAFCQPLPLALCVRVCVCICYLTNKCVHCKYAFKFGTSDEPKMPTCRMNRKIVVFSSLFTRWHGTLVGERIWMCRCRCRCVRVSLCSRHSKSMDTIECGITSEYPKRRSLYERHCASLSLTLQSPMHKGTARKNRCRCRDILSFYNSINEYRTRHLC